MESALKAGAARAEISIPEEAFPVDGLMGVHDPIHARAVVLEAGGSRIAILSLELVATPRDLLDEIRDIVTSIAGVARERVIVAATHTFGAPHIFGPEHLSADQRSATAQVHDAVVAAVRDAISDAVSRMVAATVSTGAGASAVNVNREVLTAEGWWLGANDHGPVDREVGVIRIDTLDGQPIALLVNYAVQSSIMHESRSNGSGGLVTGDLAGATSRFVESSYPESDPTVLFLVGAAADQAPMLVANRYVLDRAGRWSRTDVGAAGFLFVETLSERLGSEVVRVSEALEDPISEPVLAAATSEVMLPGQVPPRNFRELGPTHHYDFQPAPDVAAPATVLRIGDTAIVGVQPEICCETGLWIKRHSPFPRTFVVSFTNGGAKYMAPRDGYERRTYAAMNSKYARGAAELFAERLVELMAGLSDKVVA